MRQTTTMQTEYDDKSKLKNFGLSKPAFDELVIELQGGNEELFKQIYLTHFKKCVNYLIKFRGAEYENAYNSTLEALIEIRTKLIAGKIEYGNLAYYFTNLAAMKYSKIRARGNSRMKFETMENRDFEDDSNLVESLMTEEMSELVGQALNKLGEDCIKLLKLSFYDGLKWPKIARIYFPEADEPTILKKSNTLRRRSERNCLPKFKIALEKLL